MSNLEFFGLPIYALIYSATTTVLNESLFMSPLFSMTENGYAMFLISDY